MTSPNVIGNHRYADEFPMATPEELEELAASIATVGLIHPIVLTPAGEILDGRNRYAACTAAEVEPSFEVREGDDDDYKEFVIGANTTGRRESMTVQIAAASVALVLGHEKRKSGRWVRNTHSGSSSNMDASLTKATTQAGLVLDELGPAHLRAVRDGEASLNAKYEEARRVKETRETAEAAKVRAAEEAEEREQRAVKFFENDREAKAWLDSKPDGAFATMRAAFAAIQEEREEIRQAEQARRREEERRQREHEEGRKRDAGRLRAFLDGWETAWAMRTDPYRDEVLSLLEPVRRQRFLQIEKETTWPTQRI